MTSDPRSEEQDEDDLGASGLTRKILIGMPLGWPWAWS